MGMADDGVNWYHGGHQHITGDMVPLYAQHSCSNRSEYNKGRHPCKPCRGIFIHAAGARLGSRRNAGFKIRRSLRRAGGQ